MKKVLLSSDQHFPFHDRRAISLWFKIVKSFRPDQVCYLGDTDDACDMGRWVAGGSQDFINQLPPNPSGDDMMSKTFEYAKPVKEFYAETRKTIGNDAEIFVAAGNHCDRRLTYFDKKNMPDIQKYVNFESLWGLDSIGADYIGYNDRPKHLWAGYYAHHGMSISKHAGESVRNDIDNFGVSMIRGHSHRAGSYHKTYPLRGETLSGYEIGHMMDINSSGASYDNVHNWQQALAVAYVEDNKSSPYPDGKIAHVDIVRISNSYTAVVGGKLFQG